MYKINHELQYARKDLEEALKHTGGDILAARKRVMWLEDRMGTLCGKVRLRVSSAQGNFDSRQAQLREILSQGKLSSEKVWQRESLAQGKLGSGKVRLRVGSAQEKYGSG